MPIASHIFLGIIVCWLNLAANAQLQNIASPSNGTASDQPIRMYEQGGGGRRVYLHCDDQPKPNRRRFRLRNVVWHYKRCGRGANMTLCSEVASDWSEVACSRKGCKAVLDLGQATQEKNGLYRCSIRNKSPNLKTLITYELYVNDNAMDLDYAPYLLDNAPNYPAAAPLQPIQIFRPGGRDVELQCRDKAEPSANRKIKSHGIKWHYKKCGNHYGISPCADFFEDVDLSDWLLVTCRGRGCRNTTLDLEKPTEEDNGLYRCSIRNKHLSRTVVQYELEIVDKANRSAEFLGDSPRNVTVHAGQSAPFQCRVISKVKPTIVWFRRRHPGAVHTSNLFVHLNETYEQMASHPTIAFPNFEYLSKLVLPAASESDAGGYLCLAINNVDASYRQAYLTVLPKYYNSNSAVADNGGSSLHWLFLIPAALALIPVSVWLCCLWRRNKQRAKAASLWLVIPETSQSQAICNNGLRKPDPGFKYEPVSETQRAIPSVSPAT